MSIRLVGTRLWKIQKDTIGKPPYMTRITWGRLRFHIFHRADADPDPHDHQWNFFTFPLTNYVEEFLNDKDEPRLQVVKKFRLHYRPATYRHRVLGLWSGRVVPDFSGRNLIVPEVVPGEVKTIVVVSKKIRDWGFHTQEGRCFVPWKDYVFQGRRACD